MRCPNRSGWAVAHDADGRLVTVDRAHFPGRRGDERQSAPAYSSFQRRILSVFAFYTQLFGVDLNFTPFYWTQAGLEDVDHRIEVLGEGKQPERDQDWIVLPDAGVRGSDRYQRYQRLGRVWGLLSQRDDLTAMLARESDRVFANSGAFSRGACVAAGTCCKVGTSRAAARTLSAIRTIRVIFRWPMTPTW